MMCYDWDNGESLSARGEEISGDFHQRTGHTLLRPIFINAVEVGYAFAQCDKDRRLNVRGVTIALWHFISRGHEAVAFLPYCFKSYPDKSSSWNELMALFKMNLIEFTPGFGSDKYTEVNRILATRAAEVDGCIVARSQMHNIIEERPHLARTIERRLLMPSFNGNDIIFPIDGPLGRSGPTLQATMECQLTEEGWSRCTHHQLTLQDQRIWLQRLANVIPEQVSWAVLARSLDYFRPTTPLPDVPLPTRPSKIQHCKPHPPETNPVDGKGYSYMRAALRRANQEGMVYSVSTTTESMVMYSQVLGYTTAEKATLEERDDPFLPEYMRTGQETTELKPRFADCAPSLPNFLGHANSIYRIRETAPLSKIEEIKQDDVVKNTKKGGTTEREELIDKLAPIFGRYKALRVVTKNPRVTNLALLLEFALNDSEGEISAPERSELTNSSEHFEISSKPSTISVDLSSL